MPRRGVARRCYTREVYAEAEDLDPDGTPYANLTIEDLAAGADGSVYLAGVASGPVDFGDGPVGADDGSRNAIIAHLGSDGALRWVRLFGAPVGDQWTMGIGEAPAMGGVWAGYRFEGQVDFGTGDVRTLGGSDVAIMRYAP